MKCACQENLTTLAVPFFSYFIHNNSKFYFPFFFSNFFALSSMQSKKKKKLKDGDCQRRIIEGKFTLIHL